MSGHSLGSESHPFVEIQSVYSTVPADWANILLNKESKEITPRFIDWADMTFLSIYLSVCIYIYMYVCIYMYVYT